MLITASPASRASIPLYVSLSRFLDINLAFCTFSNHISNPSLLKALLETLDISNNQISRLENLGSLLSLTDLWINHNQLANYDDLKVLEPLALLTTLYLEGNPLAKDTQYRVKVVLALPNLEQLDATPLRNPGYGIRTDGVPHQLRGVLKPSSLPTM